MSVSIATPNHSVNGPVRVGILLFPGFELLDVFGPAGFFGLLGDRVLLETAAEQAGPVRSSAGLSAVAEIALADLEPPDLLLIPGGIGTRTQVHNKALLDSIRRLAEACEWVATVCTGTALLARTGVLDGRKATSNKLAFAWVQSQRPEVRWVCRARWVEDGKFFTSSGISAGMDMSLAILQKIFGSDVALEVSRQAEYLWHRDADADPFAAVENVSSNADV